MAWIMALIPYNDETFTYNIKCSQKIYEEYFLKMFLEWLSIDIYFTCEVNILLYYSIMGIMINIGFSVMSMLCCSKHTYWTVLSCITENGLSVMYLLRCSWSIACRHCSNYIFILDLTPGLNWLGKDNYKTRWETFRFWNLVRLILKVLRQMRKCQYSSLSMSSSRSQVLPRWHACQVISWYLMDIFRKKNV